MVRTFDNLRMTDTQAAAQFANEYILMRFDNNDTECETGVVLGVGERTGLFTMLNQFEDKNNCGLFSGINLRNSLGGFELNG